MKYHHRRSAVLPSRLALVALLVAVSAGSVFGQSGRRAPRSPSPPTPTPKAEPVAKKPTAETEDALSFVVGIDRVTGFANIPMYFYDTVLRACAERLDNASSAKATAANREMSRAEAIKRAKAETEVFVVWLQLRVDGGNSQTVEDFREIYVDYWVFAPVTAKVATNGRSFQQIARTGGVIAMPMPGGRANLPYTERLLKQAARDAADRILSAMNLPGRSLPGML